jgi:hypothetical protein
MARACLNSAATTLQQDCGVTNRFYIRFLPEAMHIEDSKLHKEGREANTATSCHRFLPMKFKRRHYDRGLPWTTRLPDRNTQP